MDSELNKKWENFWYYYKWYVIVGALVIVFLVIMFAQSCSTEDPDIMVLYAGPCYFSEDATQLVESAFTDVGKDYNSDGKTIAQLISITVLNGDQVAQAQKSASDKGEYYYNGNTAENVKDFNEQISTGIAAICMIDKYYFESIRDYDRLAKLEDILGYKPENAIDDYGIYLKDTNFGSYYSSLSSLPGDTVLCFKRQTLTMKNSEYDAYKQMFCEIFDFKVK